MKFKLPKPSVYLIKYGMIFCSAAMLVILWVFARNNAPQMYSYTVDILCKSAAVIIFYIFAEVIIGALAFDCYVRRRSG